MRGPFRMSLWVPLLAALSWAGLFIHNIADLPAQTVLSPESFIGLLLTAGLIIVWFTPLRAVAGWGFLILGVLNLTAAVLTVLPLPFLPFAPDQSVYHYAFHLLYGVAQVPLVLAAAMWLRRRGGRRRTEPTT